jgi:hypothetical protein
MNAPATTPRPAVAAAFAATDDTIATPPGRRGFGIAGDVVHRATANLPDDQRENIRWFAAHCRAKNIGREEMSRLLKKPGGNDYYSYDSIYQVLTGRRTESGVSIDPLCNAIAAFRRVEGEREEQLVTGFIQTRLYDIIEARSMRCLLRKKIGWVFGDSQIGKSACGREIQRRHNHGQTIFVEVPTTANLGYFLGELANCLGIPPQQKHAELRRRILDSFDDRMLLIVDEGHRCFPRNGGIKGIAILDFLRELWNRRQCGILIMMTNEGRDQLLKGPHKKALEQLWRRRLQPLQLPNVPFQDDLERFAMAYGLAPASDETIKVMTEVLDNAGKPVKRSHEDNPLRLQNHVVTNEGLGVWLTLLQDAADMAREQRRPITWGAVIKAYCLSQADAEIAV